jgi:hypothetical protein
MVKKKYKDYTGQKFNKLIAIKHLHYKNGRTIWLFRCDCGKEVELRSNVVTTGNTTSCGCMAHSTGKENKCWKGYKEISGTVLKRIKQNAKMRNLEFSVSIEYLWNLFINQNRKCVYSGVELCFPKTSIDYSATASLDRIDNSKGYVEENLQWIHKRIQDMRFDKTNEEFMKWIKLIYENTY